jgi:hypothetical protein
MNEDKWFIQDADIFTGLIHFYEWLTKVFGWQVAVVLKGSIGIIAGFIFGTIFGLWLCMLIFKDIRTGCVKPATAMVIRKDGRKVVMVNQHMTISEQIDTLFALWIIKVTKKNSVHISTSIRRRIIRWIIGLIIFIALLIMMLSAVTIIPLPPSKQ